MPRVAITLAPDFPAGPLTSALRHAGLDLGEPPDVAVLDLEAVGDRAPELVRAWRQTTPDLPILILGPPAMDVVRLGCLRAGARDWLDSPGSPADITRRVLTLLEVCPRRRRRIVLTACVVDLESREVSRGAESVRLSPAEGRLLAHLAANPGRTLTQRELLTDVWGYAKSTQSRTALSTMNRLRAKVEADPKNPDHLRAVYGQGYRFEPLQTAPTSAEIPQIPPAHTLFGRERLIEKTQRALTPGAVVVLVGPGGIGKSTVARTIAEDREEAIFCDLTPARTLHDALELIVREIGTTRADRIRDALANHGDILLVLDNVEQLMPFVDALVELAAPNVSVLLTSRVDLPGRAAIGVGPIDDDAALEFLTAVAPTTYTRHDLQPVVAALDGHPLALSIAGAQLGFISPSQLLDRGLDALGGEGDARHGALRRVPRETTQALSWVALRALRRSSLLRAPFDLETLEGLLGQSGVEALSELVRNRLVITVARPDDYNYRLLEPVRLYALEDLNASDDAEEAHRRLGPAVLRAVEGHGRRLRGPKHREAVSSIWHQLPNVAAAMDQSDDETVAELGVAIADVICREAAGWVTLLETAESRATRPEHLVELMTARSNSAQLGGRLAESLEAARSAVAVAKTAEMPVLLSKALLALGSVQRETSALEDALVHINAAIALARKHGALGLAALGHCELGGVYSRLGRREEERASALDGQALARASGWQRPMTNATGQLASLDRREGRFEEAEAGFRLALRLAEADGDGANAAIIQSNYGNLLFLIGRHEEANMLFVEALERHRRAGNSLSEAYLLGNLAVQDMARGNLDEAASSAREARVRFRELGIDRGEGNALGLLARLLHARGALDESNRCYREACVLLTEEHALTRLVHLAWAALCFDLGDPAQARALLEQVGEPDNPAEVQLSRLVRRFEAAAPDIERLQVLRARLVSPKTATSSMR